MTTLALPTGLSMLLLLAVLLVTPLALSLAVKRQDRASALQALDLGSVTCWIIFLYSFLPAVGIMLADAGIGVLNEQRLGNEVPDMALVVAVTGSYAAFMLAFAVAYAATRQAQMALQQTASPSLQPQATASDVQRIGLLLCTVKLTLLAVQLTWGAGTADDYISSYTQLRDAPILVQQFSGLLNSMDFACTVLFIVCFIAWAPEWHAALALALVVNLVFTVLAGGSRTGGFLYLFAYVAARSVFDSRMRAATIATLAVTGLVAFLLAGIVRSGLEDAGSAFQLQLLQSGEFLSLFYNPLDLLDRLGDSDLLVVRLGMYLVDPLRLIPQQIVGELKIDPATFYVSTFYPDFSEAGGGLAFGAMAESAIGFGWPESLVRGALLGLLFAWVQRRCMGSNRSVLRAFIYIWFVVMAYQSVRDTTFTTVPRFIMHVLPSIAIARAMGAFASARTALPRPASA